MAGNWRRGPAPDSTAAVRPQLGLEVGAVPICPVCSRPWGSGLACASCGQVDGLPPGIRLSSPARRVAEPVVELLFLVVTLYVGWLIWELVVFRRGQTPAKQLLGMRVVSLESSRSAGWGTMFVREIVGKPLVALFAPVTLGLVLLWFLWDDANQELWDKMVGTIVVDDRYGQLGKT
jgi:uncharacterized RDD family membrane protein YckC